MTEDRSARKRRVIVDAATTLFLRHGYLGTSMDQIAAFAAVSKPTVYKFFPDKEQLFTAIVLETLDRASSPCSSAAISSAVRSGTVAMRQCSTIVSPSNTPSTMLVFPMSIVSSIRFRPKLDKHIVDQAGRPDPRGYREHSSPAEIKILIPNGLKTR